MQEVFALKIDQKIMENGLAICSLFKEQQRREELLREGFTAGVVLFYWVLKKSGIVEIRELPEERKRFYWSEAKRIRPAGTKEQHQNIAICLYVFQLIDKE